jgi:hypothetical protein
MKKVIRLTERDLTKLVKRIISEQEGEMPARKLSPRVEKERKIGKLNYDKSRLEGLKKDISEIAEFSIETFNDIINQMGDIDSVQIDSAQIDSAQKALSDFLKSVINIDNGNTFEYPNEVEWRGMKFNGKIDK